MAKIVVAESRERKHNFVDKKTGEVVIGRIKNLLPLQTDKIDTNEIAAEIENRYKAQPSKYDPVEILYYFWIKQGLAPAPVV